MGGSSPSEPPSAAHPPPESYQNAVRIGRWVEVVARSQNLGSLQVEARTSVSDLCSIPRTEIPRLPSSHWRNSSKPVLFPISTQGKKKITSLQVYFFLMFPNLYFTN